MGDRLYSGLVTTLIVVLVFCFVMAGYAFKRDRFQAEAIKQGHAEHVLVGNQWDGRPIVEFRWLDHSDTP